MRSNRIVNGALIMLATGFVMGCSKPTEKEQLVQPVVTTERVQHDSDDPAIWINPTDSSEVLVIGTDKGGESGEGGLYAFDLAGKIVTKFQPLQRPNNVDVGYLTTPQGKPLSVAVCTERLNNQLRIFRLPDLAPIDRGGIAVFEGDSLRDPMGVALYKNPLTAEVYALVGRKTGPPTEYLWQYRLLLDTTGLVSLELVRKFGAFSGKKEIESIAVDEELGYVYYSDEGFGVHKYYAHPDSSDRELALFASDGFAEDHEGISIYKNQDGTGFILISNQQDNSFHVFAREGTTANPHQHPLLKSVRLSTIESDGSDVTSRILPGFPQGLFVAMTDNGTFQYYRWEDIAAAILGGN